MAIQGLIEKFSHLLEVSCHEAHQEDTQKEVANTIFKEYSPLCIVVEYGNLTKSMLVAIRDVSA